MAKATTDDDDEDLSFLESDDENDGAANHTHQSDHHHFGIDGDEDLETWRTRWSSTHPGAGTVRLSHLKNELAENYEVQDFPTIFFLVDGEHKPYNGQRTKLFSDPCHETLNLIKSGWHKLKNAIEKENAKGDIHLMYLPQ
nr:protein disulfide isomerase-like 1-4 [Ipomoea batatas]